MREKIFLDFDIEKGIYVQETGEIVVDITNIYDEDQLKAIKSGKTMENKDEKKDEGEDDENMDFNEEDEFEEEEDEEVEMEVNTKSGNKDNKKANSQKVLNEKTTTISNKIELNYQSTK